MQINNGCSYRGTNTSGTFVPLIWISGTNTINIGTTSYPVYVNSTTFSGNKAYNASDLRLKQNISYLDDKSYNLIMKLTPFEFNWDKSNNDSFADGKCFGIGAQDINHAMTEVGYNSSDYGIVGKMPNGYYAVNYTELIPHLIHVVQKQHEEIEALKNLKGVN